MNPLADRFDDRLEPLGVATGVFLVLMGLAAIAGSPWAVKPMAVAAIQLVGALGTIAVGVSLAALSWTGRE